MKRDDYESNLIEVINLVNEFIGNHGKKEVGESTRLLHDLHIDGEDGYEFIDIYSHKYNVDVSININDYFGSEGGFNPFLYLFLFLFYRKSLRKKPITIKDLVKGIESGHLQPESDIPIFSL